MSGNIKDDLIIACNFVPNVKREYKFGVPLEGEYAEILSSDMPEFGGSSVLNEGKLQTQQGHMHGREHFLTVTLPPLGIIILKKIS